MKSVKERLLSFDEYNEKLNITDLNLKLEKCLNCPNPYCSSKMVLDDNLIGCPIGLEIPKIISLMKYGMYKEAYMLCKEKLVFPEIISRICKGYCETSCLNNKDNVHTDIKDIIRTLSDYAIDNNFEEYENIVKNGKKVSIIGSGIAGLVCADYLVKKGYDITVYEKDELLGGTLMNAIPNIRLDKNIINRRINMLKALGVKFLANTEVSRVISPFDVVENSCAVIMASGVVNKKIDIPGIKLKNVIYATDYLKKVNKNVLDTGFSNIMEDKNVLIIGSSDTASDILAIALREKARMVAVVDIKNMPPLKRKNFWPLEADNLKIDYAIEEARYITRMDPRGYNQAVIEILGKNEVEQVKVSQVKFVDGLMEYSSNQMTFPMDYVIIAAGVDGYEKNLASMLKIDLVNDFIAKDNHKNNGNVFICGEAHINNGKSVLAVEDALLCAKEVSDYLET